MIQKASSFAFKSPRKLQTNHERSRLRQSFNTLATYPACRLPRLNSTKVSSHISLKPAPSKTKKNLRLKLGLNQHCSYRLAVRNQTGLKGCSPKHFQSLSLPKIPYSCSPSSGSPVFLTGLLWCGVSSLLLLTLLINSHLPEIFLKYKFSYNVPQPVALPSVLFSLRLLIGT